MCSTCFTSNSYPYPGTSTGTGVLTVAGPFGIFLDYLTSTKVIDTLQAQANNTEQGLTLFVPKNSAFLALKNPSLANLTQDQLKSVCLFHALSEFYSLAGFNNLSKVSPVATMAGGQYALNFTYVSGTVHLSSGWTKTVVDSAGANLAHHVAKRASESNIRQLKVKGLVAIQPFFGGEERTDAEKRLSQLVSVKQTDWLWNAFLPAGEGMNRDHEAINVSGPRAADISKLEKFPATLVFVGGFDALQDWQRRYYHWLKSSGKEAHLVEYPTMVHAFYVFPEIPESSQLMPQVTDFIHKH